MDAKLNHSDLSTLLAKEGNISASKAEYFTKAFFDLIIEGLEQDGIVKINGLGTFKIAEVASRSSVDVNTGEKIEIKGHKKISFLPAAKNDRKIMVYFHPKMCYTVCSMCREAQTRATNSNDWERYASHINMQTFFFRAAKQGRLGSKMAAWFSMAFFAITKGEMIFIG